KTNNFKRALFASEKYFAFRRGEKNCSSFFFADEPRANRMLVMKAPPQDVANLAFHHSWHSAGSHLSLSSRWTRNTSTAIHRDFFKEPTYFSYAVFKSVY